MLSESVLGMSCSHLGGKSTPIPWPPSGKETDWVRCLLVTFNHVKAEARRFHFQALVSLDVKWDDKRLTS